MVLAAEATGAPAEVAPDEARGAARKARNAASHKHQPGKCETRLAQLPGVSELELANDRESVFKVFTSERIHACTCQLRYRQPHYSRKTGEISSRARGCREPHSRWARRRKESSPEYN